MASPPSNRLLTPPQIHLDTSSLRSPSSHTRRTSAASQQSLLTPSSPVAFSLDGETLRTTRTSRSGSFRSFAETSHSSEVGDPKALSPPPKWTPTADGDPLAPDTGNHEDFDVPSNFFAFSPGQLNKLLNPKSLDAFRALGGILGLEKGLATDIKAGLSLDETKILEPVSFYEATGTSPLRTVPLQQDAGKEPATSEQEMSPYQDRIAVFKTNQLPTKKGVAVLTLLWRAYNDRIMMLLTAAAVISLALGIYEAISEPGSVDYVEGVAIVVAILIVVLVTTLSDWRREREFSRLSAKKDDRQVKVVRSGKTCFIPIHEVLVGDVCQLEAGDITPADGVLISGYGVTCDESSATGESDAVRKSSGASAWEELENGSATEKLDPFIISGTKVNEGLGSFLVTSVGPYSSHGKIMMSLQDEVESTPLQVKLGKLADWIGGLGSAAAALLFLVLLIRFLVGLSSNDSTPAQKGTQFLDILIVAVTIIVVAVPEGLPLSVLLALSFATKRMYKDNNLVRHLSACETMGNCTTICSDKTGTLTQNRMTVVSSIFGNGPLDEKYDVTQSLSEASKSLRRLVLDSITMNTTASEGLVDGEPSFVGSKTETALLSMAKDCLGMGPVAEERSSLEVVTVIPFDSARKFSAVVVRLSSGQYRLLVKGAAEVLLSQSSNEVESASVDSLEPIQMTSDRRFYLEKAIDSFAEKSLRTIAFLFADLDHWSYTEKDNDFDLEQYINELTFVGLVGIQDPLREGVLDAVKQCQTAGIKVRMVTGDNLKTATAIALSCGIKTNDGITMEGPVFRKLSSEDMDRVLPQLEVLARSSPEDKRVLVANLKQRGETVAVTGDGTNDAPALKTADVGFSMGIAGTEVAKSASDIILLDDNFNSIVKATMWGRSVNDAVQKFLQFQVTVNIAAVTLAFVSAVYSSEGTSVLTAVQLLWINLVMDTFAALALATDPASEKLLNRLPSPKSAALITANMWKMIVGQSIYQLAVTFVLYFAGAQILGYDVEHKPQNRNEDQQIQLDTIVFNSFVWMQIFNMFNNRRLDNMFNIFEGMLRNYYFLGILCIMVAGQILIVFVGGVAFQIVALDASQWGISILCALPCLLWAVILRCIPDRYAAGAVRGFESFFGAIFAPVAKGYRAVATSVRGALRSLKRTLKSTSNSANRPADIETGANAPTSPTANLPPITLTTMD